MRKLGLDVGSKSCGIAISDILNITAQGKENFFFEEKDWKTLIEHIKGYLEEFEIDVIVVGYPTYPSGDKSATTLFIEDFIELLEKEVSQKIIKIDENGTTKRAHAIMLKGNLRRDKRKGLKDMIAAQLILEDYLALL